MRVREMYATMARQSKCYDSLHLTHLSVCTVCTCYNQFGWRQWSCDIFLSIFRAFFFFFGCWRLSKWFWFCIFIFGFFSVCHNTHLGGFVLFSISSKFSRTRVFGANDISHVRQTRNECEQTAWQASGNISRTRRWGKKLTKIWRKTDPFASEHFYGTLSKAAEMGNRETELRLWKMTEWPERIARGRSSTIFRLLLLITVYLAFQSPVLRHLQAHSRFCLSFYSPSSCHCFTSHRAVVWYCEVCWSILLAYFLSSTILRTISC